MDDSASPARPSSTAHPDGFASGSGSGYTLLETLVVLAILGVLAGALIPLVADTRKRDRADETVRRLAALREAVVGRRDPAEGATARTYGFVGDLGQLPDSLEQLLLRDDLPAFGVDSVSGLGAGWRGPYVPRRFADDTLDFARDAFGRPLRYAARDTVVDGTPWAGWIRSAGPDGAHRTEDDLVAPLLVAQVRSDLRGFLTSGPGRTFEQAPVTVTFRRSGTVVDTLVSTDSLGRYAVDGLVQGRVVVRAARKGSGQRTGFVRGSAEVSGTSFQDVSFEIANVSASPVTISSLTVFIPDSSLRDRCYRNAFFAGQEILPQGGGSKIRCHGEQLVFADPRTLEAGSAAGKGSVRREASLDASTVVAPELSLGGETGGATGTALLELNDWRVSDGTGPKADMRGITLTVQFSDGLTATFEVPQ